MKKINWIFINIVTFILIACLIFLPLFKLYSPLGNENYVAFESKLVYGFNFLGGLKIPDDSGELSGGYSIVLHSKLLGFVPVMMLLSMFIIDKLTNKELGKYLINFLAVAITLVYMILLPIIASTFIDSRYYEALDFDIIWGFWICVVLLVITLAYYTIVLIKNVIRISKENAQKEYLNEVKESE